MEQLVRPDRNSPANLPTGDTAMAEFDAEAMPHLNDLYRTAARMLGDRARAEDVVQEVYLQAWKSFHRFEKGTNCRAWLFKILFHCVNHHRRKWFRFPLLKENEEFLEANLIAPSSIGQHFDGWRDPGGVGSSSGRFPLRRFACGHRRVCIQGCG